MRWSPDRALAALRDVSTPELMALADDERRARHGRSTYYVHSYNLNPTNVCENRCKLGGIRTARAEDFARMKLIIELFRLIIPRRIWILVASLVN